MRGRPPKAFAHDPDRHVMACAIAFWALGASRRGGCEIAIACIEGLPIGPRRKRGAGGHGLSMLDLEYELQTEWCGTASIEGRARGLRRKIKKAAQGPGRGRLAAGNGRPVPDRAPPRSGERSGRRRNHAAGDRHLAKPISRASDCCRCTPWRRRGPRNEANDLLTPNVNDELGV